MEPSFKAGLHVGAVTVGEIGVVKQDIVYSGDVLNTTSRIQHECNRDGADLLISAELLLRLPALRAHEAISLGAISLRGKTEPLGLHAIRFLA